MNGTARAHLVAAGIPGLAAFVAYTVFSVLRHERFGSGSWDMGCHVHNLFLLAFGKPPVSSVLGDANFWGGTNHFMPSLYLAAPLAWTGWTSSLLVLQALLVAAAVLPLSLLAAKRGLGPFAVAGVSVAYLFAVGTQTFIEFDVHETAPVPLLMFAAMLAFESSASAPPTTTTATTSTTTSRARARAVAYVALVVLAGTKESSIVYAAGVGLWLAATQRGRRIEGVALFGVFIAWFFVVTAVIQPALLEPGASMMHVARFKQLGASPADIAQSIVLHPFHTLSLLFAPSPKAQTLAVSAGGFGFSLLLSPQALLLAAPNLAERFLSDKREMWGLGFHYSLVLVGCCAYGAVDALARVKRFVDARLSGAPPGGAGVERRFDVVAGVLLVVSCALSNALAPFPPELASVQKPYMAQPDEVERYRRALAPILADPDAKVVAQNHFLPHVAFRQFIWQPEQRFIDRADWVVLDPRASPWPQSARAVSDLVAKLRADPAWTVAFEESSTIVFHRGAPKAQSS